MDLTLLLLALPVFWVAFNGLDFLLESRNHWKAPWKKGSDPTSTRGLTPFNMTPFNIAAKLGFNKAILRNQKIREKYELLLLRSGHVFGWTPEDILFYKEVGMSAAVIFLWWMGQTEVWYWLIALAAGFIGPDFYLKTKISSRKATIQRQLPGFVDLLALALESGLDLVAATDRILDKMKPSPLREELYTLLQENRLGTPRKEALQHLAFRVDLSDMRSLTTLIIQSEELGTSLAAVLRNYAEDMRNRRILYAEEVAARAPVKILFPMMVFFFPIVFVVIFGPLALNLMGSYK